MPTWGKVKTTLKKLFCCDAEDEAPRLVIGEPTNFRHVTDVHLEGLSEAEQETIRHRAVADAHRMMSNLRPIQREDGTIATPNLPTNNASPSARLDRVRAHTRQLSNSLSSTMASVGAKSAGYSALANNSNTAMQPTRAAENASPFELNELLPRDGGIGKGSSVETTTAGCEVEDFDAKGFGSLK